MPLTAKGEEIKSALQKEYGSKKGEQVLYAGKNKGTFTGIDAADNPKTKQLIDKIRKERPYLTEQEARAAAQEMQRHGSDSEINTNEFAQLTSKPYTDESCKHDWEGEKCSKCGATKIVADTIAKCDALSSRIDAMSMRMDAIVGRYDANLMPNHDFLEAQRVGKMAREKGDAFAVQPRELKRGHEGG